MVAMTKVFYGGLVFLCVLHLRQAAAACTRTPGVAAVIVEMGMGPVVIRPEMRVGSVIMERRFPVAVIPGQVVATCNDRGNDRVEGRIRGTRNVAHSTAAQPVYDTNITGVGIRLSRETAAGARTYYPHDYIPVNYGQLGSDGSGGQAELKISAGTQFVVELIKTAALTGGGALTSMDYSTFSAGTESLLTSRLSGTATTLIRPTCSVGMASRHQVVNLRTVGKNKFTHQGFVTGDSPFNIDIRCNQGDARRVALKWDEAYQHASRVAGVLAPVAMAGGASGVAIQLVTTGLVPVTFGDRVQWLGAVTDTDYRVQFKARYYQTESNVTAGPVRAVARFSLNYD